MSADETKGKSKNVLLSNALPFIIGVVTGDQYRKRQEETASFSSIVFDKLDEKQYNEIMSFCEELKNKLYSVYYFKLALANRVKLSSNVALAILQRIANQETFEQKLRIADHEGLIKRQSIIDWAIEHPLETTVGLILLPIFLFTVFCWLIS